MSFISEEKELYGLYAQSKDESKVWRKDYHEYERLAENGLIDDLDPDLPQTNDGSLSASLFKLPKRIINSEKKGRAKATNRDDAWLTDLANMQWENEIIPNANSQASFHRKWKDAVRKAAIYGSVPIITLFVERGDYTGADFIVVQPQDVKLEPSKVSDNDSDIMFWDVYLTKQQLKQMIERAKTETEEAKTEKAEYDQRKTEAEAMSAENPEAPKFEEEEPEPYNTWYIDELEKILASKADENQRDSDEDHRNADDEGSKPKGFKFCVIVQRGVDAPFYMYHPETKAKVREWSNPDPTGDVPIHFLYCYQDFVNPYGVGIVKLAGGTQNVLDYMRQADVLATQLGFRPPISISGDTSETDLSSIVYAQDAQWFVGNAEVKRQEISSQIYSQLPERMSMYKTSLNQLIPTGDTSIASGAGDPNYSKTPAGVKFQQQSLSIDDDDFKDNVDMTYEAVAKSMINTHFANMQGSDLMKLSDEEMQILAKGGLEVQMDENGQPMTNELEVIWEEARATFDFEMEADSDRASDEEQQLEALLKIVELRTADPTLEPSLMQSGKKLNLGELFTAIITLTSKNDKILEDISPEEKEQMTQGMGGQGEGNEPIDYTPREEMSYKDAPEDIKRQMEAAAGYEPSTMLSPIAEANQLKTRQLGVQAQKQMQPQAQPQQPQPSQEDQEAEQDRVNAQAIMEEYDIDENHAMAMIEAEKQGFDPEEIKAALAKRMAMQEIEERGLNV